MTSPNNTPMHRPKGLPADARWEPEHPGFEWHQGSLDADGKRHGAYRSWTADGLLHGSCWYEHGKLHGSNTNYHPDGSVASVGKWVDGVCMDSVFFRCDNPTTEPFPDAGPKVRSVGYYTHDGTSNYTIRYFDAVGDEVGPDGEPLPPRPDTVPDAARWFPDLERWVDGAIERGTSHQIGRWRWWSRDGVLRHEELRDARGEATMVADHRADGSLEKRTTTTAAGTERDYYSEAGGLSSRYRDDAQGRRVYKGNWFKDGSLREETVKVFDGDDLVSVTERGEGGALVFGARREGAAMACVLYGDRGSIRATGLVADGQLHGTWRIFGEGGTVRREIDATPLGIEQDARASGLAYHLGEAVFRTDEPVLPTPPQLAGVDDVAWGSLQGAYGDRVAEIPRLLRGLVSPDELVRDFAFGAIRSEISHQGSTYSSTAAVIPWFATLLSHPEADRSTLLAAMQRAGEAAAPYLDEVADQPKDSEAWLAIAGTHEAVGRAWPQIWALFPDASEDDRQRILVLAKFAPEAAVMLAEVARGDADPAMRACAVDSLTDQRGYDVALVAPALADPDPLVRAAVAIAIGLTKGPDAPPAVVPALAEAVRDASAIAERFSELPYTDGHVLSYLALAAGSVRTPAARELVAPLCARIDEVDGASATSYGRGLCALAFGRGERPFAPQFIDVLDALARSERFWAFNVNAGEVLDSWNLREGFGDGARERLAALVVELRAAPDPEAELYARMHAGGLQQ